MVRILVSIAHKALPSIQRRHYVMLPCQPMLNLAWMNNRKLDAMEKVPEDQLKVPVYAELTKVRHNRARALSMEEH